MKENLRRLHLIFRLTRLRPEMFYCINVWDGDIILQGHRKIIGNVNNELKFEFSEIESKSGSFDTYRRNNLQIIKA